MWGDGIPVTLGNGRRLQRGWEGSVVRGGGSRGVKAGSTGCQPGCRLDDGHAGMTTQATHPFSGRLAPRKRSLPSQDLLASLLELASGVARWGPGGPGQGRGDSGPSTSSWAAEGSSMIRSLSRSEPPSQDVLRSQGWGGALEKGRLSQGPRRSARLDGLHRGPGGHTMEPGHQEPTRRGTCVVWRSVEAPGRVC